MTSQVCIWTQLALFEGCEEQVKVLVGIEEKEEESEKGAGVHELQGER